MAAFTYHVKFTAVEDHLFDKYVGLIGTVLGNGNAAVNKTKFLSLWNCNSSDNYNIFTGLNALNWTSFPLLKPCFQKKKKRKKKKRKKPEL